MVYFNQNRNSERRSDINEGELNNDKKAFSGNSEVTKVARTAFHVCGL